MKVVWTDKKRHLGLPISFTRYTLSEDRVIRETGMLNLKEEEILLYRVRDISLTRNLWQRIFGVGTICLMSTDKTAPHLDMVNIKNAKEIKEQIFEAVEAAKKQAGIRTTEIMSNNDSVNLDH